VVVDMGYWRDFIIKVVYPVYFASSPLGFPER